MVRVVQYLFFKNNYDKLRIEFFVILAENTGVKQLKDSFQEIKTLTSALIDAELPTLLQPENIKDRQKKYPVLSLEKLALVLDKYKDTGFKFTKTTIKKHGFLSMDGREKSSLMKLIRSQL